MTYRRFEELPVWADAIDLAVRTFAFSSTGSPRQYTGLRNQLEWAVVPISNNIAEGFERRTNQKLLTFLYIARGSAGEVRSMFTLLERLPGSSAEADEVVRPKAAVEGVSRQLGRWIESIKDSGFRGTRARTSGVGQAEADAQRRWEFLEQIDHYKMENTRRCFGSLSDEGTVNPEADEGS